ATQSPFIVREIIRGRIGFGGLLLTDDLDMEALYGSVPERAELAIAAGCDIALNCWAKMDDMVAIAERLPAISGDASQRLYRALASTGAPQDAIACQADLLAKRDALLSLVTAHA
ncbi:MAG: glycoside hydrolase family 3 N-terminal domain-containing protein, partial [Novosphingobium sp.]